MIIIGCVCSRGVLSSTAGMFGRPASTAVLGLDRQQILQDAPLRLGEIAPAQECLQKAALNQSSEASPIRSAEAGFADVRGCWYLWLVKQRSGYDAVMHEVCVEHGWCGGIVDGNPSHVDDLFPEQGPVTADQFVDCLFMADGMDPNAEPTKWREHKQGLRDAFIRHMGHDTVDASSLKWAHD